MRKSTGSAFDQLCSVTDGTSGDDSTAESTSTRRQDADHRDRDLFQEVVGHHRDPAVVGLLVDLGRLHGATVHRIVDRPHHAFRPHLNDVQHHQEGHPDREQHHVQPVHLTEVECVEQSAEARSS